MYRIPADGVVEEAVSRVLGERKEVHSQALFSELVLRELRAADERYVISGERLRRIVAGMKGTKILVEKMRSRREAKSCYVCGGELLPVKTRNLLGGKSVLGKRCERCGFSIERENSVPRRYIFQRG